MADQKVGSAYYELTARDQALLSSLTKAEQRITGTGAAVEKGFGGAMDRASVPLLSATTRTTTRMGGIFASGFDKIGSGFNRLGGVFATSRIGGAFDQMGLASDRLMVKSEGLTTGLGKVGLAATRMGGLVKGSGGLLSAFGIPPILGWTAALGAVVGVLGKGISAASNMNETVSKVSVVFGNSGPEILKWGEGAATAFGQSKAGALEAAATFGNLFVALKLPNAEIPKMSKGLVELASDLASFNNVSPTEALDALRSGLVGETEPLRRFGVNLNEATIAQKAMELGLIKSVKDGVTPAIKAQASYALILEQTKTAQGDFARTSDGLANQQRIAAAKIDDAFARMGAALLPLVTKVLPPLADAFVAVLDAIGGVLGGVGQLTGAAKPLVDFLGRARDQAEALGIPLDKLNVLLPILGASLFAVTGKLTGFGSAALGAKLGILGMVVEIADGVKGPLDDAAKKINEFLVGSGFLPDLSNTFLGHPQEWEWPWGPKNAPEWAGGSPSAAKVTDGIKIYGGKIAGMMAGELRAGAPVIAAGATSMMGPLAQAQIEAQRSSTLTARQTPAAIAQALRDGANPVKMAAALLKDAMTNEMTAAKEISILQATLTGSGLAKALHDKRPGVRAAAQAYKTEIEDRLYALRNGVPGIALATGQSYADALQQKKNTVGQKAAAMVGAANKAMNDLKGIADDYGRNTADAYANALAAELKAKQGAVLGALRGYQIALRAGSPPLPGAVLYGIDRWGAATGEAYWRPLVAQLERGVDEARSTLNGLGGGGSIGLNGFRPGGAGPIALPPTQATTVHSGTTFGDVLVQLHVDKLVADDAMAVRDLGRALGSEIRLSMTRTPAQFVTPSR